MKHYLIIVFSLVFGSLTLGQEPSPSPLNTRIKNFGSSLERFEKKNSKNSREKQKGSVDKQPSKEPGDDDVIRVETDLVVQDVLVTDQKGNVITGLNKGDFIVLDNGVPQSIEIFASGTGSTVPRSVVLIIDCGLLQTQYLEMSVEAAKTLVDKLDPQDKMAIVTADGMLHLDFTTDRTLLKQTLDYVEKKGRELALWYWRGAKREEMKRYKTVEETMKYGRGWHFESLIAVLNELFDEPGRQRIVLFQGEGTQVIWLKPDKDLPYPVSDTTRMNSGMKYVGREKSMSKFGFSEVKETIESSRATIYSVITGLRFFGLPEKERKERAKISFENMGKVNQINRKEYTPDLYRMFYDREERTRTAGQAAMYRVAELSGGNTAVMEKPEDAERIYSDIFAVIKNRYVLGYYPTNRGQGEKRRNVKVEVRGHPEYIIDGRKTYILQ